MVTRASTPDDTFKCYRRALAGMGYNREVEDADRSPGVIPVVKDPPPYSRSLSAFINEVQAQTGLTVDAGDAAVLIAIATALMV